MNNYVQSMIFLLYRNRFQLFCYFFFIPHFFVLSLQVQWLNSIIKRELGVNPKQSSLLCFILYVATKATGILLGRCCKQMISQKTCLAIFLCQCPEGWILDNVLQRLYEENI